MCNTRMYKFLPRWSLFYTVDCIDDDGDALEKTFETFPRRVLLMERREILREMLLENPREIYHVESRRRAVDCASDTSILMREIDVERDSC